MIVLVHLVVRKIVAVKKYKMGIQGLLPLLKPIQKPVSIAEDFAGQVIGVDAYCWLHKGAYGCAMELVEGKKSFMYVLFCCSEALIFE